MLKPSYEIRVTERHYPEHGEFGFKAVEIVPPISRELATLVCEKVVSYCNEIPREDGIPEAPKTVVNPYGFCDEGATVNTLLVFQTTPTFEDSHIEKFGRSTELKNFVAEQLSPSGVALAARQ